MKNNRYNTMIFILLTFSMLLLFFPYRFVGSLFPSINLDIDNYDASGAYPPPIVKTPSSPTGPYKVMLPVITTSGSTHNTPAASVSRYINGIVTFNSLYNLGCAEGGQYKPDIIVILDFGRPRVDTTTNPYTYGTLLVDYVNDMDISEIESSIKGYIYGYYQCSQAGQHLTMGIGTNNSGTDIRNYGSNHGTQWAEMIKRISTWVNTPPSYADRISVAGAIDIEPGYNSPTYTTPWVESYNSVQGQLDYYNYGSCDSCPYKDNPGWVPLNNWTLDLLWKVSYGLDAALTIPEIYSEDVPGVNGYMAHQWQNLKSYAITCTNCLPAQSQNRSIFFFGSLTQFDACHDPTNPTGSQCINDHLDNTPSSGYNLFWNVLNSDTTTAQDLVWSTDISWKK